MSYSQLITPNPNIPCKPGWCLQYVRQTFGLAGVHPSATAGWNASPTQHPDLKFPEGVWVPVWFGMASEPLGHVVLRAPDGSIYSTSDNSTVPHHHPDLSDLIRYYARAGVPLTYRGWTEDIEDVPVIAADSSIKFESAIITPTPSEEDDMSDAQYNELIRKLDAVIDDAHRTRGVADAIESDGIRARIVAIDTRTASLVETTKYIKGPDEPQIYEIIDGTGELRNVGGPEWEATKDTKGLRILPQPAIDRLLGK